MPLPRNARSISRAHSITQSLSCLLALAHSRSLLRLRLACLCGAPHALTVLSWRKACQSSGTASMCRRWWRSSAPPTWSRTPSSIRCTTSRRASRLSVPMCTATRYRCCARSCASRAYPAASIVASGPRPSRPCHRTPSTWWRTTGSSTASLAPRLSSTTATMQQPAVRVLDHGARGRGTRWYRWRAACWPTLHAARCTFRSRS